MNDLKLLKSIFNNPLSAIESDNKLFINNITMDLLNKSKWRKDDVEKAELIIKISNSLYNNTDLDILPLDDGVYDLLLENTRKYDPGIESGAMPGDYGNTSNFHNNNQTEETNPLYHISDEDYEKLHNMMFGSILSMNKSFTHNEIFPISLLDDNDYISKRKHDTKHEHPELVGTLDKCKYVLCKDAEDRGVLSDSNVKIVERDWIAPCIGTVFGQNDIVDMILSLKYDGVSIEADVNTEVISARTRGDTDLSVSSDLTPIFKGYKFPDAVELDEPIGMKFEAIITYPNLEIINRLKGTSYINGRTAIIGILGSSDAYKYRDFITLVPLETTLTGNNGEKLDRLVQIEFMNKYYCRDQLFRYQAISGNYVSLLYQIKRYTEEAEFARGYMPFMYDGIVIEFYDPNIRSLLGRKNSINKYAMAVKFNPLKRKSTFRGFKYTIGQSGVITPMLYFDPVEFLGAIHDHTTGYSYEHFNELNLYIGDVIDIDYNHDVMPYVSKPDIQYNRNNHMRDPLPEELFPTKCPFCGSSIILSKSNKSAYCMNTDCPGRKTKRVVNMIDKLCIKDIAEERISTLEVLSLRELYAYDYNKMENLIGKVNAYKLKTQLLDLMKNPTNDYFLIGALGFTNMSAKTWQLILNNIYLADLYTLLDNNEVGKVIDILSKVKGIGDSIISTIVTEFPSFKDDIKFILDEFNIVNSYGSSSNKPKVRCTGFRDKELMEILNMMGYDADDNAGVTKDTQVLLIPYNGYESGNKIKKALQYGVSIVSVQDFKTSLNIK